MAEVSDLDTEKSGHFAEVYCRLSDFVVKSAIMPAFCCGFNEFGQVSSEADNLQRGFVSLPAVVDLQSKIASVSHEGTDR